MAQWKLCFVPLLLLLLQTVCYGTEVKTIRSGSDVTTICSNTTRITITLVVCRIRTERSGDECRLLYKHGGGFESECDSRFSLMMENQTVFLHLTSLTPVDSMSYSCECAHTQGTTTLRLNITVEEDEDGSSSTQMQIPSVLIVVPTVIVITGVLLGFICRGIHHGVCSRSATSELSVCETPGSLDKDDPDDPDDPYTSLQQPACDLYQTIPSAHHQHDTERISASNNSSLDKDDPDDPDDPYTSLQQPAWDLYQTMPSSHHQHDTERISASNNIVTPHMYDQEIDGGESYEIYENI